jgi:hypothetical protein
MPNAEFRDSLAEGRNLAPFPPWPDLQINKKSPGMACLFKLGSHLQTFSVKSRHRM